MSERPIRSAAQVAAATGIRDERAEELLFALWVLRLVEPVGGGYRATETAWATYPRPKPKQGKKAA